MNSMEPTTNRPSVFLGATIVRALVETWLLGMCAFLGLVLYAAATGTQALFGAIALVVLLTALWNAVRLRVPDRESPIRHLKHEMVAALLISPAGASLWLAALWALGEVAGLGEALLGSAGATLLILATSFFFLVFRSGIRIWLYWDHLRRYRLVWAYTHTQLKLVLIVVAVGALAASVALLVGGNWYPWQLDTWAFTLLALVAMGVVMTLVVIALVFPPALLLSWLTARKTVRRLEVLTRATGALRRGDYGTRISVEGEDEIAQLQADFNAMASALEGSVHDLAAERDKVAKLLDLRRQLVANVSHELRTPLATLRGYLESLHELSGNHALEEKAGEKPSRLEQDLQIMEDEVFRLQRLIDDLLTLSRAELGELSMEIRATDLGEAIHRRVEAAGGLAWQRERVRVVADVPDGLPQALVDQGRFEQVLANLIRNALRHTPPGGIVAVSAGDASQSVWVRVCDTGEGIPTHEQERIWERFYRGDAARTRDTDGAGLGLAVVRELVEAMAGEVTLQSQVEVGSCFTVRFPRA